MDNISQQLEEIEALQSIFENEWNVCTEGTYSMEISKDVKLFVTFTPDYPSNGPPKYELLAPGLSSSQKNYVDSEFQRIYEDERGNPIIFQWIEKLKEAASSDLSNSNLTEELPFEDLAITDVKETKPVILNVIHGPIIVDRKSSFQGHACEVKNETDVKEFMQYLLDIKKVAQATHNISAYRIASPNSTIIQDCDDDGETHASSRILHLLQILKLTNVMVVVSRWYGGIHLGPDRFKHINNAARQVLVEGGFIKS